VHVPAGASASSLETPLRPELRALFRTPPTFSSRRFNRCQGNAGVSAIVLRKGAVERS